MECLVEATIEGLQYALSIGALSSVDLTIKYLRRVATYDTRGPCLNSIVLFNPNVFDEAAASDARRAAGQLRGPLDGIPYTLKDSMKYKGMTCASGSPALEHFVANDDAFVAEQLRDAGAILIGKTNTPPMMASGMHRVSARLPQKDCRTRRLICGDAQGLFGRAESPYNLDYLTAAVSNR
jgi:Asp-tRNA(Asn)/Glu-tRNA(Gln) amidotransferase A subunit family amidase